MPFCLVMILVPDRWRLFQMRVARFSIADLGFGMGFKKDGLRIVSYGYRIMQ